MGRETIPAPDFLTPVAATARAYDAVARVYDEAVSSPRDLAENEIVGEILRAAVRRAPSARVLDLGCGTGLAVDLTGVGSLDYLGIDLSEGMLAVARELHPRYAFWHGDVFDVLPEIGPETIGLVVSTFGALNHVHPLRLPPLMHEMARVLEPGGVGVLMFAMPERLQRYVARAAPSYLYGEWAAVRSLPDSLRVTNVRGLTYGHRTLPGATRSVRAALIRLRAERWLLGRSVRHADWMIFEIEKGD